MKNYLLILVTIFGLASCSRKNVTIVRGKIKNIPDNYIYLDALNSGSIVPFDSCKLYFHGRFRFKLHQKDAGYYDLRLKDGKILSLILSPGEKVDITSDYDNFYGNKHITGSENTVHLNVLHDSLRNAIAKLNRIKEAYTSIQDSNAPGFAAKRDSLVHLYQLIKEKHRRYSMNFILKDLRSLANVGALYQNYGDQDYVFNSVKDIQFFKLVSDTLSKFYPKLEMVKILENNYHKMHNDYQRQLLLQMAGKSKAINIPDLDLPDRNGKLLNLSGVKGKEVLVVFWSVNQPESIVNLEGLKDVYRNFHNKGFEIYQVSVDKSLEAWKNKLRSEAITWPSVCDTAFPNSQTRNLFNVDSIPLNYLIDRIHNKITYRNLTPAELNKKLSTLLK